MAAALPPPPPPPRPPLAKEAFGDVLTQHFIETARWFANMELEPADEAMLRECVTAARATIKRVDAGAVAVSSPAVLRKLRATAKIFTRILEEILDDDVDDDDVDSDPSGDGDASVVKKKAAKAETQGRTA